jgi:hypothetical protein
MYNSTNLAQRLCAVNSILPFPLILRC